MLGAQTVNDRRGDKSKTRDTDRWQHEAYLEAESRLADPFPSWP